MRITCCGYSGTILSLGANETEHSYFEGKTSYSVSFYDLRIRQEDGSIIELENVHEKEMVVYT